MMPHADVAAHSRIPAPLSPELADSVAYCLLVDLEHGDLEHRCYDCGTTWKEPHLPSCLIAEALKEQTAWVSRGNRLRRRRLVHSGNALSVAVHNP